MRMKLLALALLGFALAAPAAAQVPPYVYAVPLGTTSAQVLNNARKRVVFQNPNAAALVGTSESGEAAQAD